MSAVVTWGAGVVVRRMVAEAAVVVVDRRLKELLTPITILSPLLANLMKTCGICMPSMTLLKHGSDQVGGCR